ncbi:interferon-induced protein with tetratricopeptide repeats 1B-like [Lutra lutra]|uniref:interferon-induced protein with tetratricopeptide repeats 1B-like n=1 Tax=Lutra lutra TaxID=9657 RepID=UPI001FD2944A|nr:interferon-induced protein with tetratricopeptide repeats 1B-like [Lutra lutra]
MHQRLRSESERLRTRNANDISSSPRRGESQCPAHRQTDRQNSHFLCLWVRLGPSADARDPSTPGEGGLLSLPTESAAHLSWGHRHTHPDLSFNESSGTSQPGELTQPVTTSQGQCLAGACPSDRVYFLHSEVNKDSLEKTLAQLKCHFTWNLPKEDGVLGDLEDRVCHQIESVNSECKATMSNFLAYIKHLRGHHEEALECLRRAEELIGREHPEQADIRSLVTWGNFAWVSYHLGRHADAQMYVEKVGRVCKTFPHHNCTECPLVSSVTRTAWGLCRAGVPGNYGRTAMC